MIRRLWLVLSITALALGVCLAACTNDYGQFRVGDQSGGNQSGGNQSGGDPSGGGPSGGDGGAPLLFCNNGTQDGDETDVDCGGSCTPCDNGQSCGEETDCISVFCDAGTCAPCTTDPQCSTLANGFCNANGVCVEGMPLPDGDPCVDGAECASGNCVDGVCCAMAACASECEMCNVVGSEGSCAPLPMGTSCGSPIDDGCANPDTCDAAGACQSNDEIDGAACSDCPAGASFCAGCQAAVCQNLPCGSNVCLFDTHCRPVATNGLCNDVPNDCLGSLCVGETAPGPNDAGISASENLESWQSSDDETTNGGQRWYCNVTQAVGAAGVLTDWDLFVDNGGANGEVAQFAVIRCSGGGGGAGPALSGCVRVGIGPAETINGDGMHSFSLSGSTQLDLATPSALGIVVEAGDWICADSNAYDIGVDCNGAAAAGGCPGPDFNTQQLANVDVVGEPFALQDSNSDGTLMIRASGFDDTGTAGACSDTEQLPAGANCSSEPTCNPDACDAGGTCVDNANVADTTLCNNNGGDTCCVGACIVGPSGAGTCQ